MSTPEQIVSRARAYLGVRWHHQGRNEHGLDCAGLVIKVANDLGLSDFDFIDYDRRPFADTMRQMVRAACAEVTDDGFKVGRIALMRFGREPQHLGIIGNYHLGGLSLIHAYVFNRKVVEHKLDDTWRKRIVALYELPGVTR